MAESIVRLRVESQEFESKLKRASQELLAMAENARRTGATVIAIPEVIGLFPKTVLNFAPMNLGGRYKTDFGTIKMVQEDKKTGFIRTDESIREMNYSFSSSE